MSRCRPRTTLPTAVGVVLCLVTASCIGSGSSDDDAADVETTRVTEAEGADDPESTTTTGATESSVPAVADLTDVAWVVNDFDGLIDDQGRVIAPPPTDATHDPRPSVVRAVDGSIYYILDGRLWRRAVDQPAPEEIDTEADEILGVAADRDGNIVVNPYGDPEIVAEASAGGLSDTAQRDGDYEITASNDITVRILAADVDVDDLGYVTEFRSPARLQVERNEVVEWTIDAGGVAAPWLSLLDFDGRFVLMTRAPTEPADPMLQHIVYDLDCPTGDAGGRGCTRTFWAFWGTAALVGADRGPGDDDLNTVLLEICPTQGVDIAPPAEMTDPASFDEDFTAEDLAAFRLAALQLTTCDPSRVGDPRQPGLRYEPGSDDPDDSGWMWTNFARSLRGPFIRGQDDTWIWARHEDGPLGVLDQSFGPPRFHLQPGRRHAEHLELTVTADSVTVAGRTDSDTAETVVTAARSVAGERGIRLSDWIDPTGTAHAEDLVDDFVSAIETDLMADVVGEVHLTADGVIRDLRDPATPTAAERDLGFLMADFASGGEGVYAELPLADDILVALGSEVVARRQPTELFRRSAWVVNSTDFAGRVGPFNVLDLVPSPSEVVIGPHARCAGPEAIPSPPELVSYTRIGILPLEGSIGSCLDWSAVDLFVDDTGRIHGVALHLEAP
ncbi:MAG: hypothetical protein OES24_14675 [Acidimicrobiia bacterium]|nr:hypothetical protein [Acidimicrobiia bacterium]